MKTTTNNKAKFILTLSMILFGTIGIFRRYLQMPSSVIACARAIIGTLFLLIFLTICKKKINMYSIRKNFVRIILSGILLGFNWILLFEAYEYTSVAVATLCYYMAPILVILVSPIVFREKLTHKKCLCILIAVIGMVLVSGVLQVQVSQGEWKGILLGLGAAGLYAMVVVLNKKMSEISPYDKTIGELLTAAVVLIPYICFTEDLSQIMISPFILVMLLVVGILHTGIAYAMYFGSMEKIHAQTVAILSYIDPVVAILLSACFLHETMKPAEIVGAVLVLGSTIVSELEVS